MSYLLTIKSIKEPQNQNQYTMCLKQNILNIFDCYLKDYKILVTFRTNIPEKTCH